MEYIYLLSHEFCYAVTVILVIKPDTVYWHLQNKEKKRDKHKVFKFEYMNNIILDLPSDPQIISNPSKGKKG